MMPTPRIRKIQKYNDWIFAWYYNFEAGSSQLELVEVPIENLDDFYIWVIQQYINDFNHNQYVSWKSFLNAIQLNNNIYEPYTFTFQSDSVNVYDNSQLQGEYCMINTDVYRLIND